MDTEGEERARVPWWGRALVALGLAAVVIAMRRVRSTGEPVRELAAMALAWPATWLADGVLEGAPRLWEVLVVVLAAALVEATARGRWWIPCLYVGAGLVAAWIGLQRLADAIVGRV